MGLAGSQAAISSTRRGAQMVVNSFRNSSSKNCFPSILLQFRFIYYLAVSRWSHFSSELLERDAWQLCSRLGGWFMGCVPQEPGWCPCHSCSWQNVMLSGLPPCGMPFGDRGDRCRHVTQSKMPHLLPPHACVESLSPGLQPWPHPSEQEGQKMFLKQR